ncbi:unnamed protein product [Cutaneotrichosporon oleaginosum]
MRPASRRHQTMCMMMELRRLVWDFSLQHERLSRASPYWRLRLAVHARVPVLLVSVVALGVVRVVSALEARAVVGVVEEVDAEVGEAAGAALGKLHVEDLEIALRLGLGLAVGDCVSEYPGSTPCPDSLDGAQSSVAPTHLRGCSSSVIGRTSGKGSTGGDAGHLLLCWLRGHMHHGCGGWSLKNHEGESRHTAVMCAFSAPTCKRVVGAGGRPTVHCF